MTLGLFLHFARLRLRERMEYRAAFVLGLVSNWLSYAGTYVGFYLLLQRFHSIGGWTFAQIVFLFSLNLFSYALAASCTMHLVNDLEGMIATGTFDTILIAPLNTLLHLVARKYTVDYVSQFLLSGIFLLWSIAQLHTSWGVQELIYLILAIVGASCLQVAILLSIAGLTFSIVRIRYLVSLFFTLKNFISYPLTAYNKGIEWLLTVVVPLAFINFYPASLLLHKNDGVLPAWLLVLAPLVGPCALVGACRFFSAGVARYQGAGG